MPSDGPDLMTRTAPAARTFVGSPDLAVRVRRARNLALDHLLDTRTAEGCWRQPFDLSAMSGAAYVVMLRTTGLIEQAGAARDEMMLVRHMLRQRNRDGGFFKFPGSPSSRAVTALVLTALRALVRSQSGTRERARTVHRTGNRRSRVLPAWVQVCGELAIRRRRSPAGVDSQSLCGPNQGKATGASNQPTADRPGASVAAFGEGPTAVQRAHSHSHSGSFRYPRGCRERTAAG